MIALDIFLQVSVMGGFVVFAYSKIKGQPIRETIEEIMDFLKKFKNE